MWTADPEAASPARRAAAWFSQCRIFCRTPAGLWGPGSRTALSGSGIPPCRIRQTPRVDTSVRPETQRNHTLYTEDPYAARTVYGRFPPSFNLNKIPLKFIKFLVGDVLPLNTK